jgi:hypothetical protein
MRHNWEGWGKHYGEPTNGEALTQLRAQPSVVPEGAGESAGARGGGGLRAGKGSWERGKGNDGRRVTTCCCDIHSGYTSRHCRHPPRPAYVRNINTNFGRRAAAVGETTASRLGARQEEEGPSRTPPPPARLEARVYNLTGERPSAFRGPQPAPPPSNHHPPTY